MLIAHDAGKERAGLREDYPNTWLGGESWVEERQLKARTREAEARLETGAP